LCAAAGIDFLSVPIPDRGVPESHRDFRELALRLSGMVDQGKCLVIHCRQGVGRAAMMAAAILVTDGATVDDAFDRIAKARGCPVPDTPEQRQWLARFNREFPHPNS
jgi:protein-tyrosine phosphatase